jgi:uncharacterized alpha-E superfamily protein
MKHSFENQIQQLNSQLNTLKESQGSSSEISKEVERLKLQLQEVEKKREV